MGTGLRPQDDPDFGNGEVGGDRSWTSPVYGNTGDGQDVTVSFGRGTYEGQTDIASGHLDGKSYYVKGGHDHYGPNGESYGDRGAYKE